jgi:hypothetical protein
MPNQPNQSDYEGKSAVSEPETSAVKEKEYDATGGQAPDDEIADVLDEGVPAGQPGGQLRGDQTEGHRGGSRRQTQNRGRN